MKKMHDGTIHGIVPAGSRGFRAFVARNKNWCKVISFRFVILHSAIPPTVIIQK